MIGTLITCLTCFRACVLTCWLECVLTCLHAFRSRVLKYSRTCLACLWAYVLACLDCLRAWRAYVFRFLACLRFYLINSSIFVLLIAKILVWYTAWKVFVFRDFLVRIFLHSDWIRRDIPYISVFSLNVRKYGPEKLRMRVVFMQWQLKSSCEKFHDTFLEISLTLYCLKSKNG